ncbi:hypothetical protein [Cupriavidus necator]|nr:hypothetical protein [Cupriavidus necator]
MFTAGAIDSAITVFEKMLDALVRLVVDSVSQLDEAGWRYDRRQ